MLLTFYTGTMLLVILSVLYYLGLDFFQSFRVLKRSQSITFILVSLVYLFLQIVFWPSLTEVDMFFIIQDLLKGRSHDFQGYYFSGYVNLWKIFGVQFFAPVLFQIFLGLYSFLNLYVFLDKMSFKYSRGLKALSILFFLSPLTVGFILFYSRDSLVALSFTALFMYVYKNFALAKSSFNWRSVFLLSFLFFVVCNLRQEGLILYLFFLPAAYIFRLIKLKQGLKTATVFALTFIVLTFVPRQFERREQYSRSHMTTAMLNPLGEILYQIDYKDLDENDFDAISRVADMDCFKKYFNPLDIEPLHRGCIHVRNDEDLKRFLIAAMNVFRQYPNIYVENRVNVLLNAANFRTNPGVIFVDYYHRYNLKEFRWIEDLTPYYATSAFKVFQFLHDTVRTPNDMLRISFFSLLIPTLFAFVILFSKLDVRFLKTLTFLILLRSLIVFFLSPTSYFKYYHIHYFFLWVAGLVYLGIYFRKRAQSVRPS